MPTQPRSSPSEHYAESERLLRVAETSVVEEIQTTTALLALAHAILTLSRRKARRAERPTRHHPPPGSGDEFVA
jgi:hypothetical protein